MSSIASVDVRRRKPRSSCGWSSVASIASVEVRRLKPRSRGRLSMASPGPAARPPRLPTPRGAPPRPPRRPSAARDAARWTNRRRRPPAGRPYTSGTAAGRHRAHKPAWPVYGHPGRECFSRRPGRGWTRRAISQQSGIATDLYRSTARRVASGPGEALASSASTEARSPARSISVAFTEAVPQECNPLHSAPQCNPLHSGILVGRGAARRPGAGTAARAACPWCARACASPTRTPCAGTRPSRGPRTG